MHTRNSSTKTHHKKDGFDGQRAIVLPKIIIDSCRQMEIISNSFITDIGFYPKAKYHYRNRSTGITEAIIIYCTDGEGWVEIADKSFIIKNGQFIIIPAHTAHTYGSSEENPWSIYWLHFSGSMRDSFVSLLSHKDSSYCNDVSFSEERIKLFDSMYELLESGYSIDNLMYVNMSLWNFIASLGFPDTFQIPIRHEHKDSIDRAIDYMKENMNHALSLQDISSYLNISQPHFSAMFKKKTGYPPLEYFNHMKIQKACQYLRFTDIAIKEVAYKLGFDDPYYFSRLFSNIMGISPMAYKKEKRNA